MEKLILTLLKNIVLGISLAAPIGPVSAAAIKNGMKGGFSPAFSTGLGAASADTTILLLIYLGLARFMEIPAVQLAIYIAGSAVLIYLGVTTMLEKPIELNPETGTRTALTGAFASGYVIAISSPITIVWWLGVFGAILADTVRNATKLEALLSSLTIVIGVVLWFVFLAVVLHAGKRFVNEKTFRAVSATAGIVIIGFGVYFAWRAVTELMG
ncbi:MAG: LysE family transporter [Deltaproteobacteria bacterium]|nr:LysE family transporter [Candidatus Zymogenaceae bacterium]